MLASSDILTAAVVAGTVGGIGVLLAWCYRQVRDAVTGRRNEGMDAEYEARTAAGSATRAGGGAPAAAPDLAAELPCPGCGYDLRAGHDRCPECGVDPKVLWAARRAARHATALDLARLHNGWPASPITPTSPEPWEELAVLHSDTDGPTAELLVEQLRARGVWACIRERSEGELISGLPSTVTYFRVQVPAAEHERAEAVLTSFARRMTEKLV